MPRRLRHELLERRTLLAADTIRLVSWNTENNPDDAAEDALYSTIFEAIGLETVAGNTLPVTVLALQETDLPGSGSNSIGRIEAVLDDLYPSTDYASEVTTLDGGGDATGFVYDTSMVELLSTVELSTDLTHTILRAEFRPDGTLGDADFFVYSVHLKAGTSGSDATTRASEASLLRDNADLLGEGENVLIVGDFNMQGTGEAGWTEFVVDAGAGQVQDVAGAPNGTWNDNPAFLSLHSQNPGGPMDDRFDLQLASGELFDGFGIDYVDGSYRVFGNNGTHSLNGAITTGTGASPTVLSALAAASDHLPVIADYAIVSSTPAVLISETGGGTTVAEGGAGDTYSVTLSTIPTDTVTVTLTPDSQLDIGASQGTPIDLVFTPGNAQTPQFVTVSAFDDVTAEGTHTGSITHTAVSVGDGDYDGIAIAGLTATILDDETPTVVINEIDSDTAGIDELEFVELYDGGVGNTDLSGLSVVFFNGGNSDQAYAVFDLTGFSTDANGFFVLGNSGVNPDLTFDNNTLQNGADAVALYTGGFVVGDAATTTNLVDAIVYDTNDSDDAGLLALLLAGGQINEDSGTDKDIDAIARVPDGGALRDTTDWVVQLPTPGASNAPGFVSVTITQSAGSLDIEEGGASDSYQIALSELPTHDVTITIDPDDEVDLGAGVGLPVMLTFTPVNGITPQTVTVTAFDDSDLEGDHSGTITHTAISTDSRFDGIGISDVIATITDNEVPPVPSIVISEIMYDPNTSESSPGNGEWIEIVNTGDATIDIGGWLFDDEDSSDWGPIPQGTMIDAGQVAVFYKDGFTDEATFRSEWGVPAEALVIGIDWGSLANSPSSESEILELRDSEGAQQDLVNFDDSGDWPANTDGPSIYLTDLSADNNVGTNWAASVLGMEDATSPFGPTFSMSDVGSPGNAPITASALQGDYNGDGFVNAADYTVWRDALAAGDPIPFNETATPGVTDGGDYLAWRDNFGATGTPAAPVFVGASSTPEEEATAQATVSFSFLPPVLLFATDTTTQSSVPPSDNAVATSPSGQDSLDLYLAIGREEDGGDKVLPPLELTESSEETEDEVDQAFALLAVL